VLEEKIFLVKYKDQRFFGSNTAKNKKVLQAIKD